MRDEFLKAVDFAELIHIKRLGLSNEVCFGGVGGGVKKGHEHDVGQVDVFGVNAQGARDLAHGMFQAMRRTSVEHQSFGEFLEKVLFLENVGNLKGDADPVFESDGFKLRGSGAHAVETGSA